MPGKVSIPDLIIKRDSNTLTRGERALLSLLELISAKLEDFTDESNYERLVRELENAANSISQEVFEYWSQNKNLKVRLTIGQPESGAVAPLDKGPILHLRVENTDHGVTVPFDERSRGFVWFFSFLAYFSELEGAKDRKLILLLDEPGLSLHATAQGDLLRFIDERLVPKHQVLYSTHSPFMIAPDKFERVRTVQDLPGQGTKVSEDILKVDAETAFPLQAALGYELAQTLFVGKNNLLLEGPSDLIYLDIFSAALEAAGKNGLDEHWVKVPVGGAGKLSTFVSLLGANKLKVAVVVDSSTKGAETLKQLNATGKLKGGKLVQISEITGSKEADIEDILDPTFYLELVNEAYKSELSKPIKLTDLTSKRPRITQRVEDYFIANSIGGGKLNHYRPSVVLLKDQAKLVPKIDGATLTKVESLINRLNSML
jgi:predicted ATP-dependent endonuclease of OLD family